MSMPSPIRKWLTGLGLEAYSDAFEQNDIDLDVAPELTDEDLRELGIASIGHRRKVLRAIAMLNSGAPPSRNGEVEAVPSAETALSLRTIMAAPTSARAPADRRQLTVLFCDLADSTALSSRLDAEDYREFIRAYQDACAAVIVRYEGYVARYMGDGVLAYFGWPRGHEDDAERAVRAGLGIVAAVRAIAPPKGESTAPRVRIGIATGSTIVGDIIGEGAAQEAAATGMTPNLAARLQQIANPDSVVISKSTQELVRDLFSYENLGFHSLKGIDHPVEAWQVTGVGIANSRFAATHRTVPTPLVGRAHELSLLRERWEGAQGGEGWLALLIGEAGIGKSRLTEALIETLQPGSYFDIRLQCSPYDTNSAFSPVIHQLERAAGFAPEDDEDDRVAKLDALLAHSGSSGGEDLALLAALLMLPGQGHYRRPDLSPQQLKQRTLDVLRNYVLGLARKKPVLLVWEDAHWIDPSSLELLELIVERIPTSRLMLIVTQRPEWNAPFLARPNVTLLHLGRLGRSQVAAIVRSVAATEISKAVIDTIVGRTDGVPLFVEEVTRSVVESGLELTPNDVGNIPSTLQASLMARLDRLPGPAKDVAQVAAVIGREVPLPLLTSVVEVQPSVMAESLEDLFRSQLMLNGGSPGGQRIAFRHALIRDAAYQSLLMSRRRKIHHRIADTIQTSFPQLAGTQPELVAQHYASAGEPSASIAYWRRAGQRSTELMASQEAVEHFKNALAQLALIPPSPERDRDELEVTLAMGVPLIAATGYGSDDVREAYTRARELAELLNDAGGLFTSTRGLWNCIYDRAETDLALELATNLTLLAGSDADKLALAERALGSTYMTLGRFDEAVTAFNGCLSVYDNSASSGPVGDQVEAPTIVATQYKGFVCCIQGRPKEGLALMDAAVEQARALRHPLALAFAAHVESAAAMLVRDYERAWRLATETLGLADEHGLVFWIAGSKITLGCATVHLKRGGGGLDMSREGLREWRGTAAALYVPTWSALIADAALSVGDLETANSLVTDALPLAEANHDVISLADLQRLRGDIAMRRGEPASAKLYLETAIATAISQGARLFSVGAAIRLAKLLIDTGDRLEARRVLQSVLSTFTDEEEFSDLTDARRLLLL